MFLQEFYDSAIKLAGVDLDVNFTLIDKVGNTIKLLSLPLSTVNANLYCTKLMSILFSKEEMAAGFVEYKNLDKKRIDLIKGQPFPFFHFS